MNHNVKEIHNELAAAIAAGASVKSRAVEHLQKVNQVIGQLVPQIKHLFPRGFVAAK